MEHKDNAARIVACVNACEGIADPSVVPEMVTLLEASAVRLRGFDEMETFAADLDRFLKRVRK